MDIQHSSLRASHAFLPSLSVSSKSQKYSSTMSKSVRSDESSSDSDSNSYSSHNHNWKAHCSKFDGPKVLLSVNNRFCDALDHQIYPLADKSSNYDDRPSKSVTTWTKWLQVQLRTNLFDSLDFISIISFLSTFKLACDTNGTHKDSAIRLLHFFMKKPAAVYLNSRKTHS